MVSLLAQPTAEAAARLLALGIAAGLAAAGMFLLTQPSEYQEKGSEGKALTEETNKEDGYGATA